MNNPWVPQRWLVVILTHNEPISLIEACLRSVRQAADFLTAQYQTCTVHIRVVDDSAPQLRLMLQEITDSLGIELVHSAGTISQKRNAGCKNLDADVIVFTDADCQVDQQWLIAHASAYAKYPTAPGVAGVTIHQAESTLDYTAARYAGFLVGFQFPEMMSTTPWAPCSNLSLRMDIYRKIGGFDEAFAFAAEDVDMGLRVCAMTGQRIVCQPSALVYHAPEPFARGLYRRAWVWGKGEALLLTRHARYLVPSPPPLVLFVLLSLGWTLTCALAYRKLAAIIIFLAIYVFGGPLLEAWETKASWSVIIRARLLQMLFQLGTCVGLLKAKRPDLLGKKMNYGEGQFAYEWPIAVRTIWEFFIFLLLMGVIA
jgi:GT2 family glycosyltransferase